ncbi:NgoMIV family type II restriction endonuclease [Streptomyces sp. NRRL S-87]|uniref:NgoMIV family type II restriction endonuclease n=1 Tax=Streptomyces sp. NRRL S-87 TaxID=1463920 RepID=UPI0004C13F09|nr:NgoMIV family type II restriction endonuclease [Streptomyces sp. NRRL S-87]
MNAPFATELLGWKPGKKNANPAGLVPNCADSDSLASVELAAGMLDALGVDPAVASKVPADPGGPLEVAVQEYLAASLGVTEERTWHVQRGRVISEFFQYEHLRKVDELLKKESALRVTIGTDYLIKPDVTVAILGAPTVFNAPFLHAAVSCKWTIRSDRVQNVRHEFNQMIKHRRGRLPHLMAVTAEPLPTRLASIARGTGEVDAVYHIAFDALAASVAQYGSKGQQEAWEECVQQGRLLSFSSLVESIASW